MAYGQQTMVAPHMMGGLQSARMMLPSEMEEEVCPDPTTHDSQPRTINPKPKTPNPKLHNLMPRTPNSKHRSNPKLQAPLGP